MNNKISALLKDLRTKHNLTQEEFGERIGVGPTTISNYESGYSNITPARLKIVAKAFGLKYSYFFDEEDCFDEKVFQNGIVNNRIPFYKSTNINGILLNEPKLADSFITLPSDIHIDTSELLCTNVIDNSMSNAGIKSSSYVIVNIAKPPLTGNIVLVHDTANKRFIVKKYISDGPLIMLISENFEGDNSTIYTNKNDKEYSIIGTVEKAIITL